MLMGECSAPGTCVAQVMKKSGNVLLLVSLLPANRQFQFLHANLASKCDWRRNHEEKL